MSRYTHVAFEFKLEEIVGDFGSTLTREHKHLVHAYSYRKVATGWRNLTALIDLKNATTVKEALKQTVMVVCHSSASGDESVLKHIVLASSQHACSRSCRLMVHISFNLPTGENMSTK